MARNQELLNVLLGLEIDDPSTAAVKFAALDALIHADLANANNFRQAVVTHSAIFGTGFANQNPADADFLHPEGEGNLAENNLRALQRVAAEKRVMLGMISMPFAGLKEIASVATSDALRALLAPKPEFGVLATGYHWAGTTAPLPLDPPLLSEVALVEIKERARVLSIQKIDAEVRKVLEENNAAAQVVNDTLLLIPRQSGLAFNTSIDTITNALTPMGDKLQRLQTYLVDNEVFLNLTENQAAKAGIVACVAGITGVIASTKKAAKTGSVAVVTDKAALIITAVRPLNFTTATKEALKPIMETAVANFATIAKAFQLAEVSGTAVELARARTSKNTAERSLINLQVHYFSKQAIAESLAVGGKIAEFTRNTGTEESKRKILGEAEALLRSIQKAHADAVDAKTKATANLFADEVEVVNIDKAIAEAEEALKVAKKAIKPLRIILSPQAETPDFGNMYMKHAKLMQQFTDKYVSKANAAAELASVTGGVPPTPPGAVAIRAANESLTTFERVQLDPGDFIYSTARFNKEIDNGAPDPMVTGKLTQDHTGKVTDMTTDKLSPRQLEMMAIKQADMRLTNYKPGSGSIIIGPVDADPVQANRVYAALLGLMADNPLFKTVEIESEVPGCQGPVAGYLTTNARAKADFIKAYLPTSAILLKGEKAQVGQFTQMNEARQGSFKEMKEQLSAGRTDAARTLEQAKKIQEQSIDKDEKIDLEGKKVVPPRPGPG